MKRTYLAELLILLLLIVSSVLMHSCSDTSINQPTDKIEEVTGNNKNFKEGELLIKFKDGTSSVAKINSINAHSLVTIKEFRSLAIYQVKLGQGLKVEDAIKLYESDPNVEYAEPNYILNTQTIPDDPGFDSLWNFNNIGQSGGISDADIDAPEAWNIATGSSNLVIAVVDTGVDYNHEDIATNMWVNPGEIPNNGIDDDGNGYVDDIYGIDTFNNDSDPLDDHSHGTHVSGIIGAVGNNSIGVVGVNWDVRIMACKFLNEGGSGYTSGAIECLDYIRSMKDSGVNIIATNNSWGGGGYSQSLYDAITAQQDILFIAAAGNAYSDNDVSLFYPASYRIPNIIAVAATDHSDMKASFSNYGRRSVHVGAPGVNIFSTEPGNTYNIKSGTSMAAPHVTGLAALIKSQDITRDWIALKNLILSGGDNIASMDNITITSKRINAYSSLTCTDSPVFSALQYPSLIGVGDSAILSALSINCESPVGTVTVATSEGEVIELYDDGVNADLAGGDGIFTGVWTASNPDINSLTFSSPAGSETLQIETVLWIRSYEGGGVDRAKAIAIDKNNNIYVTGGSVNNGLSNYFIIKYDSSGNEIWRDRYNRTNGSSIARGVAVAKDGSNVYVTGESSNGSSYDLVTIKYDSSGNIINTMIYDSSGNDYGSDVAVDENGNVYVTGSASIGTYLDYFTIKYDSSGNEIWSNSYDGGGNDVAGGIAIDRSGNVYVNGQSFNGTDYDFITIKYDSSGNALWIKTYDAGKGNDEKGFDIAVDMSGNVYGAGTSYNGSDDDYLVIKYDPSGGLIWAKIYDRGDFDQAKGIAIDRFGYVYVTGNSRVNGSNYNYFTIKYDRSGNEILTKEFKLESAYAQGIAVDGDNNVIITGDYFVDPDPVFGINRDYLTIKYKQDTIVTHDIIVGQGMGGNSRVRDFDNCGTVLNITIPAFGAGLNPDGALRAAKGDVTGDGVPEIVVGTYGGTPGTPATSRVRVFDLAGALLTTINTFGTGANPTGNVDVGLGDLDMDGINEIIVGVGENGGSRVRIFDDSTAGYALLRTFTAFGPGLNPNGAVFVDGGYTDITGTKPMGQIVVGTGSGTSRVRIFDYLGSATPPALVNTINAFGSGVNPTGRVDVGVGSLDSSGIDHIIVGAGNGGSSRVKVFDETGAMLDNFMAYGAGLNQTGLINVSAGDADADGIKEIIAGTGGTIAAPGTNRVRVFDLGVPGFICNINAYGMGFNPSGNVDVAGAK